jgi:hydroxymethylbilane synthase/uroporphyrinogen III methyltransferase/synthase
MIFRIGTRGSKLALAQTNSVIERLRKTYPKHEYQAVVIKTTGDLVLDRPLDAIGSKGIFVDEIEKALLNGDIQLAVHSMKDMPGEPAEGLVFAKAWKREDPRDVLVLKDVDSLKELRKGANIATGSKRRTYQLLQMRSDINICPIRGNIDTRLRKLQEGLDDGTKLDGVILAAAGLRRLGLEERITQYFDADEMIPAPAQGTLALELSKENTGLLEMIDSLFDESTEKAVSLERGFLNGIGGDCHLPVGAYAEETSEGYRLYALFGNEDGSRLARTVVEGLKPDRDLIERAVNDIRRQLL